MVDSDNVLLLRPARASSGFAGAEPNQRAAGIITASIFYLGKTSAEAFAAFFAGTMRPRLELLGASVLAELVSETRPNNFPALPVREEDAVFVWFGRFDSHEAKQTFSERLRRESGWRDAAPPGELLPALMRKPEFLQLAPFSSRRD